MAGLQMVLLLGMVATGDVLYELSLVDDGVLLLGESVPVEVGVSREGDFFLVGRTGLLMGGTTVPFCWSLCCCCCC